MPIKKELIKVLFFFQIPWCFFGHLWMEIKSSLVKPKLSDCQGLPASPRAASSTGVVAAPVAYTTTSVSWREMC